MDLELEGKRAIVTGGSRVLGSRLRGCLGKRAWTSPSRRGTRSGWRRRRRSWRRRRGRRVLPYTVDTGDDASVRDMVDRAAADLGGVDILINGAAMPGGFARPPTLSEVTVEAFWDDMNVKVMGYLRCAQAVAPHMISQGWGRIINLSGMAARQSGTVIGSMRNVAVVAMTKTWPTSWASTAST